jgi:CRISPR/Cas system-associated protein Cas10 (large subunit of type III CRISPR-Cas system)
MFMVVIFEPDARDPTHNNPQEYQCSICGNNILYRFGDLEVQQDIAERKCPVCKQALQLQVSAEIREQVKARLLEKIPPEILDDALKWQNKKLQAKRFVKNKREKNPLYGQPKEWVEKKKQKT